MHLSTIMTKVGSNGMRDRPTTPYFELEEAKLRENLEIFKTLATQTGIKWLYTLKAFDAPQGLSLITQSFDGVSLGNLHEYHTLSPTSPSHIHSYAPAYQPHEIRTLAQHSQTMSFNSLTQWQQYQAYCATQSSLGLRINPKLKLQQPSYCDSNVSRLGIATQTFLETYQTNPTLFQHLEGLHFHAFCGQGFSALDTLLTHIETNYQAILPKLTWLNLGGGQNITHPDYPHHAFIERIQTFSTRYPHLTLYFEPGTAVVYQTGTFVTHILDIIEGDIPIVILNTSIETHLLDIAITKQQPSIQNTSASPTPYLYQITGISCIAGDTIGDYYFKKTLHIGDTIIFDNMLGYTFVKQTEFNGIQKAALYLKI